MDWLRRVVVVTNRLLFKSILEIFDHLTLASIGRRGQCVASEVWRIGYMGGFLYVHWCIKELANLAKGFLLKRIG